MDACRIGWGKIIQSSKFKVQSLVVETKQLTVNNQQLALIKTINKVLKVDYKGKSFLNNLQIGDWVSFHWGFVCDILTSRQVKNLEFYTQQAINFFNRK
jgi:hydrogenase maturation factor